MGDQKYTRADVAGRNGRNGAPVWIIIKDVVYDVTSYLQEHPGGDDVISDQAGKDTTSDFESVGHSSDAKSILKKYMIGQLVEPMKPETARSPAKTSLVPQKKIPSQAGPPSSSTRTGLPPSPPSNPPAVTTSGLSIAPADESVVAPTGSFVAPSQTTTGPVIESPSDNTLAASVSTTPASNVPTRATLITSPILGVSASESTLPPNSQPAGTSNSAPASEATVTSSSAFNRPASNAPKNEPTEGLKNVTDTTKNVPVKETTSSKPIGTTMGANNSSTVTVDSSTAAAVKGTSDLNKSKTLNDVLPANGQKTGLVFGSPGNSLTKSTKGAPMGQPVDPPLSLPKSSQGLSMNSSLPTSTVKSSKVPSAAQPVPSSSETPATKKSQLPWNTSSKPTNTPINPYKSSSTSFNVKSGSYDPFNKAKGSFSSFKKK